MTWQLMQANGKKRRLHLTGQYRAQTRTRSFITQHPDQIFAIVGRGKERQTLNVIPVRVCNEKCQLDRSWSQLLLQRKTETTNSSARVEHDNFAVGPHFYATGITTIPDRRRPGHRERAAHAPQFYARRHRTEFLRRSRCPGALWNQESIDRLAQDFPCNRL